MTLTEVLIVVVIISILIVISIVFLRSQIFKANDAKRKTDIARIQIAVEEYEKDHDCYPLPQLVVCSPGTGLQSYLNKIPCDPVTKSTYFYDYQDSSCPRWYRIFTKLDYTEDSDSVKKGCKCGCGPNYAYNYFAASPNAPLPQSLTCPSPTPGGGGGTQTSGPGGGTPTPNPSTSPTPTPTAGPGSGFYGCKSGICTPINWDPSRPGPECDPNYQNSNCYGQCGQSQNECVPWQ